MNQSWLSVELSTELSGVTVSVDAEVADFLTMTAFSIFLLVRVFDLATGLSVVLALRVRALGAFGVGKFSTLPTEGFSCSATLSIMFL